MLTLEPPLRSSHAGRCASVVMALAGVVAGCTTIDGSGSDGGLDAAFECVEGPENTEAACSDGCSNDGDRFIDCNDWDCGAIAACVEPGCTPGLENTAAACSDGCSNDGDRFVDCDDFDCESACVPPLRCPMPELARRAVRDGPAPTEVDFEVDATGRLVSVAGAACEEIEPRPRVEELYHSPPTRCVTSYRCGSCIWTFRDESALVEGPGQVGLLLWSDRETDDATAPACPEYSSELYTLDVLGNPYHRGPSDPWRDCASLGGVLGPNGACLITDCARCPSDAACRAGGLSYCVPEADCSRDADCPRGWQCQEIVAGTYECRIPCTTTTSGSSPECPGSFGCTDDTTVGRTNHWCVDREYQQRACDSCLDSCRDLPGVTNCCCGSGCICEDECLGCTYF